MSWILYTITFYQIEHISQTSPLALRADKASSGLLLSPRAKNSYNKTGTATISQDCFRIKWCLNYKFHYFRTEVKVHNFLQGKTVLEENYFDTQNSYCHTWYYDDLKCYQASYLAALNSEYLKVKILLWSKLKKLLKTVLKFSE